MFSIWKEVNCKPRKISHATCNSQEFDYASVGLRSARDKYVFLLHNCSAPWLIYKYSIWTFLNQIWPNMVAIRKRRITYKYILQMYVTYEFNVLLTSSPDSVVRTGTRVWPGRSGVQFLVGARGISLLQLHPDRPTLGSTQPPIQKVNFFPGVKGPGMMTTRLRLAPRLKMSAAIPLRPVYDFMALSASVKVAESKIPTLLLTQLPPIRMTTVQNVAGRPNAPRLRGFL